MIGSNPDYLLKSFLLYVVAVFLAVAFISHEEVKSMIYLFLKNVCAKGMRNEIYTIWTERD